MKNFARNLVIILIVSLLFCGCVSSNEKNAVKKITELYFSSLESGNFAVANQLVFQADSSIQAEIDDIEVNRFIFKNISYDLWGIKKDDDGILYADLVIHQLSLSTAVSRTAVEYNDYVSDAFSGGKVFTNEALENKWNSLLLKNVKSVDETVSKRCSVPLSVQDDGTIIIHMTAEFRNCLFGGELDAINALKS